MKIAIFALCLFSGCASMARNDAYFKSAAIDNKCYREIPGRDMFICKRRSACAEEYHHDSGFEYRPKTMVYPDGRDSHRCGDVYWQGQFLRESMCLPGMIGLSEYIQRVVKK